MNSRSKATLAPLGCLFDSASVKWYPGTPGGAVSIIPSLHTAAAGLGFRDGICFCQIWSGSAGAHGPTLLLPYLREMALADLFDHYTTRVLIENTITESIDFFHLGAHSPCVSLNVEINLQLTLLGGTLRRLLGEHLGPGHSHERSQPCSASSCAPVPKSWCGTTASRWASEPRHTTLGSKRRSLPRTACPYRGSATSRSASPFTQAPQWHQTCTLIRTNNRPWEFRLAVKEVVQG